MIDLLLITTIIVFIIDLSGFIQEIETIIWRRYFPKLPRDIIHIPKPFSCSLCLTFWSGLAYLIITGQISIPLIAFTCLLAYSTPIIGDILQGLKDLLIRLTSKIN